MKQFAVIVLMFFVFSGLSHGYIRELWEPDLDPGGLSWNESGGSPSSYFSDGKLVYRVITGGTYAVPSNSFQTAVEHGVQSWEDISDATIAFSRGLDITTDSDEDFSIGFSTADGDTQWGGNIAGVAALTTLTYIDFTNAYYIYNADVCINTGENPTIDGSSYLDVERTVMHEFGHVIGLSHSPHSMSEMSYVTGWNGTNYTGVTEGRRLIEDDKLGAVEIYPDGSFSNSYGSLAGTVTLDGANVHLAQVAAYNSNGIVNAVTLSYQGDYYFKALPSGTYTLKVFETFSDGDGLHHLAGYFNSTVDGLGSPDAFITTEDNDITGVNITAGALTTQDIAVSEGSSSIKVLYALAESEGTYNARQQVLRIKRGESLSVGILGTNLPTSTVLITELSVSGSGVSLSDIEVGEVTTEGMEGLYQLIFTVSVDADAVCGPRDLSLTTLSYSDERYLIFGFLDVYDNPGAVVSDGPNVPEVQSLSSAQTNVVMAQFSVSIDTFDSARLRGITLSHFGTGNPEDVSGLRVYLDNDSDGEVSGSDTLVGSGVFESGRIYFPLVKTVSAGSNVNFLVVYDFVSSASGTYACLVDEGGLDVTGLYASSSLTPSGLPYKGAILDVNIAGSLVLSTGSAGNDFNGDRASDLVVFDDATGYWYALSADGELVVYGVRWGWPGAVPVAGDYDGDGVADLALFDDVNGYWYIFTLDGTLLAWALQWGWDGAYPVSGDYNGDGVFDLALYDDGTGSWYILGVDGELIAWEVQWGWSGATPVPGDYNGDGASDLAVYDTLNAYWFILSLSQEEVVTWGVQWGVVDSVPVSGDYNGDGYSDLAIFHPESGYWFVRDVEGEILVWATMWGWSESEPVSGDYDGNGISDFAVFYKESGYWYIATLEGDILLWGTAWGGAGSVIVSM